MINSRVAAAAINRVAMMKFFPQDDGVKAELAKMLVEMCSTDEQVEWLAKRMANLFNGWPGPYELRAVFCSKFTPKDGIECDSDTYPDGIPSEIPMRNYELLGPAKEQRAIAGEVQPQSTTPEGQAIFAEVKPERKAMSKPSKAELEASRRFFIENGLEALCPKK